MLTKSLNKKTKTSLRISISVFLAALLVLSGVGIYFGVKNKNKGGSPAIVDPLAWSTDSWNGIDISSSELKSEYAGRTDSKTITSAASFIYFIDSVNEGNTYEGKTVYLNSNIDLSGYEIDSIGSIEHPFKGTFDGGYYTIQNTNINGNGLFNYTENATIKNLGLYNAKITGADSVGGLIGHAKNTNIENSFVRLGEVNGSNVVGGLVGVYESDNGRFSITNSFADTHLRGVTVGGLVGKVNTQQTKENEVEIASCYYTYGNKAIGLKDYAKETNILRAKKKQDFNNEEWNYSAKYSDNTTWTDYANVENSTELDFTYPLLRQYVKVTTTGSFYEGVTLNKTTGEYVDATSLTEAVSNVGEDDEIKVTFIAKQIESTEQAVIENNAKVEITALRDLTIKRAENNTDSVLVSKGNSHLILGEENSETKIVIDGNSDKVKSSSSLIVAYGDNVEMHSNVVLQNNVNNTDGIGGGMLVYANENEVKISGVIKNCHSSDMGGGIAVVGPSVTIENAEISYCSSKNEGGAIATFEKLPEQTEKLLSSKYGKKRKVSLLTENGDISGEVNSKLTSGSVTLLSGAKVWGCATLGSGGAIASGYVEMNEGSYLCLNVAYSDSFLTNGGAVSCTEFVMNGGLVFGNTCNNGGGAIICPDVTINGGVFAYNGLQFINSTGLNPKLGESKNSSTGTNNKVFSFGRESYEYDFQIGDDNTIYYYGVNASGDLDNNYEFSGRYNEIITTLSYFNDTSNGGAIYNSGDSATLECENTVFTSNFSKANGGALYFGSGSTKMISNITFNLNSTGERGGAIYAREPEITISLWNSVNFNYNSSNKYGGAIYLESAWIDNAWYPHFNNNSATLDGGAVYTISGSFVCYKPYFENNKAGRNGGALYSQSAYVGFDPDGPLFGTEYGRAKGNTAGENGGAFYINEGSATLQISLYYYLESNSAKNGGAIYVNNGWISLWGQSYDYASNIIFDNNSASNNGGAIYLHHSQTNNWVGVAFSSNSAIKNGGAVYVNNMYSAYDLPVYFYVSAYNNKATNGGAFYLDSGERVEFWCSVFQKNVATETGGAIYSKREMYFGNDVYLGAVPEYALENYENSDEPSKTGNSAKNGGAIYTNSKIEASESSFEISYNSAEYGGAIYTSGNVTLDEQGWLAIHHNTATKSGGGIYSLGNLTYNGYVYDDVGVYNNSANAGAGGGIYVTGTLTLTGGGIGFNTADMGGGVYATKLVIENGFIHHNTARAGGGATILELELTGGDVYGNEAAENGGGIYFGNPNSNNEEDDEIKETTATISGGTIQENISKSKGAGIYAGSPHLTLTMSGGSIYYNWPTVDAGTHYGGGIYAREKQITINITGGLINYNGSTYGGGIYVDYSTLNITGGDICYNIATINGGAICAMNSASTEIEVEDLVINNATFDSNEAQNGHGGAIYTTRDAELMYEDMKITNCVASGNGGAVYATASLSVKCFGRYTNNQATNGGAFYGTASSRMEFYATYTINSNIATNNGGGIYHAGSSTDSTNILDMEDVGIQFNEGVNGGGIYATGIVNYREGWCGNNNATNGAGIYSTGTLNFGQYIGFAVSTGNNTASGTGGGIYSTGNLIIGPGACVDSNMASGGAGIYGNVVTMLGGFVTNNTAKSLGGGIDAKTLTIEDGTISGNRAYNAGGGVNADHIIMNGGTISNNIAAPESGVSGSFSRTGGGIRVEKSMTMTGGFISDNEARSGGGIYTSTTSSGGTITLTGGRIENNSASSGDGIYTDWNPTIGAVNLSGNNEEDIYLAINTDATDVSKKYSYINLDDSFGYDRSEVIKIRKEGLCAYQEVQGTANESASHITGLTYFYDSNDFKLVGTSLIVGKTEIIDGFSNTSYFVAKKAEVKVYEIINNVSNLNSFELVTPTTWNWSLNEDKTSLKIGSKTISESPRNIIKLEINSTIYDFLNGETTTSGSIEISTDLSIKVHYNYVVNWIHDDGYVLETDLVNPGETPTYDGEMPVKEDDNWTTYTFMDWEPEITACTSDVDYETFFYELPRPYWVTWVNYDGTKLYEVQCRYGDSVMYEGEIPYRYPAYGEDPSEYYEFAYFIGSDWYDYYIYEPITVTQDLVLEAFFYWEMMYYTVTWKNGDGSDLYSDYCYYGQTIYYDHERGGFPTMPVDDLYIYDHISWIADDGEDTYFHHSGSYTVIGNAVIRPNFMPYAIQYDVTWDADNGEAVMWECYSGWSNEITISTPTKVDPNGLKEYTFEGWYDNNGNKFDYENSTTLEQIIEDGWVNRNSTFLELTARYTETIATYIITWKDDDGTILKTDEHVYGDMPSYGDNPTKVDPEGKITYRFIGWSPEVSLVTGNATYVASYEALTKLTVKAEGSNVGTYGIIADDQTLTYEEKDGIRTYWLTVGSNIKAFTSVVYKNQLVEIWLNGELEDSKHNNESSGTITAYKIFGSFNEDAELIFKYFEANVIKVESDVNLKEGESLIEMEGKLPVGTNEHLVKNNDEVSIFVNTNAIDSSGDKTFKFIGFKDHDGNYYGTHSTAVVTYKSDNGIVYEYSVKASSLPKDEENDNIVNLEVVVVEVVTVYYVGGFTGLLSLISEEGNFVEILDTTASSLNLFVGKWKVVTDMDITTVQGILPYEVLGDDISGYYINVTTE